MFLLTVNWRQLAASCERLLISECLLYSMLQSCLGLSCERLSISECLLYSMLQSCLGLSCERLSMSECLLYNMLQSCRWCLDCRMSGCVTDLRWQSCGENGPIRRTAAQARSQHTSSITGVAGKQTGRHCSRLDHGLPLCRDCGRTMCMSFVWLQCIRPE